MNEKLAKKLAKLLTKAGLDEDEIDVIIEEIEQVVAEEVTPEEVVDNPDENGDQVPPEEVTGDVVPPLPLPEEVPPLPTEEIAPTQENDGSINAALQELAAQEQDAITPQSEVIPPTPDQVLPPETSVPQIDPSQIEQLINDLGEANKTIEGLTARINSLEEALKGAGVITSNSVLGDETPRITRNAGADQESAFDDILSVINGK